MKISVSFSVGRHHVETFSVYRKNQQKHMLLYTVRGKGWLESAGCRYILGRARALWKFQQVLRNTLGIEEETWRMLCFLSPDKRGKMSSVMK